MWTVDCELRIIPNVLQTLKCFDYSFEERKNKTPNPMFLLHQSGSVGNFDSPVFPNRPLVVAKTPVDCEPTLDDYRLDG